MMNDLPRSGHSGKRGALFHTAGWLFADLLLALAMIFLIANTRDITVTQAHATPTPTFTPIPTATPLVRLETKPTVFSLTVDYQGLLAGSASARQDVANQVRAQHALKGRRAGLVLAFGGAPDQSLTGEAEDIASKVEDVLRSLGNQGFVFIGTSYHPPFFSLYSSLSYVNLEVYLYAQS